jgi:hypothetical protein
MNDNLRNRSTEMTDLDKTETHTLKNGEVVRLIARVRDFDAHDRNEQSRWMKGDSSEGCTMCGRRIGKNDLYVFHIYGCEAVHIDDVKTVMDSDPIASWVGWYRIGSGCARKLPKGYAFTVAQYNRLNRESA